MFIEYICKHLHNCNITNGIEILIGKVYFRRFMMNFIKSNIDNFVDAIEQPIMA